LGWNVVLGAAALEPLEAAGAVVAGVVAAVEDDVAALAELPVNMAAPIAPPMRVEPTSAADTTTLRMGFIPMFSLRGWSRHFRAQAQSAVRTSRSPRSFLGISADFSALGVGRQLGRGDSVSVGRLGLRPSLLRDRLGSLRLGRGSGRAPGEAIRVGFEFGDPKTSCLLSLTLATDVFRLTWRYVCHL
jgi:hypothetical protein